MAAAEKKKHKAPLVAGPDLLETERIMNEKPNDMVLLREIDRMRLACRSKGENGHRSPHTTDKENIPHHNITDMSERKGFRETKGRLCSLRKRMLREQISKILTDANPRNAKKASQSSSSVGQGSALVGHRGETRG